jgi:hypothetical protein
MDMSNGVTHIGQTVTTEDLHAEAIAAGAEAGEVIAVTIDTEGRFTGGVEMFLSVEDFLADRRNDIHRFRHLVVA